MSFNDDNNSKPPAIRAGYPTPLPDPISKSAIEVADAFNELWINENEANADSGLGSVRKLLGDARIMFGDINNIRTNPDVRRTQSDNDARIVELADKVEKKLLKQLEETRNSVGNSLNAANRELEKARGLEQDGMWATSIAGSFAKQTDAERITEAEAALQRGDKRTMAALLNGPHYASGLTIEQQAGLQVRYDAKYAEGQVAKVKSVELAQSRLEAAAKQLFPTFKAAYQGTKAQTEKDKMWDSLIQSYELS